MKRSSKKANASSLEVKQTNQEVKKTLHEGKNLLNYDVTSFVETGIAQGFSLCQGQEIMKIMKKFTCWLVTSCIGSCVYVNKNSLECCWREGNVKNYNW